MTKDYIYIGPTPSGEDCAQVGSDNYREKAKAECNRYIKALRAHYGEEPNGALLKIKWEAHDFGSYAEVVCVYDTENEEATKYAFKVEEGLEFWPQEEKAASHLQPLTLERVMEAVKEDDGIGFCLACGAEQTGCEPDARNYSCDHCGYREVFGADEILLQFGAGPMPKLLIAALQDTAERDSCN